ncbi:MAG: NlpC/P60 family protein [Nocardioidaceae bacterium]
MYDGRKRVSTVIAALCVTALGGSLAAAPTFAQPSIATVQTRVSRLYHQAEQASERYNGAQMSLQHARTRLRAAQTDVRRQQALVAEIRKRVASAVVADYQGQAFSSATQVMVSRNPSAFVDRLVAVSQYHDNQVQMMQQFASQTRQLQMRQQSAQRELTSIAATKKKLAAEKAQIDRKAGAAKRLLSHLKAKARARAAAQAAAQAARAARSQDASRSAGTSPSPAPAAPSPSAAPASGRAAQAVAYAMAQVGKSYVYGATGPSSFDCSGLTMRAWQSAGVTLPRTAAAQMSAGTPVSSSNLQPGDLVFYYSPVSHVGMYIGNGRIVNAENPSVGVVTAPVFMMPYAGAVRPG